MSTVTDQGQRRAAALKLDADHPNWTIWWGPVTRHFWAMPARGAVVPVIERAEPDELVAAMREVEVWHGWPQGSGGRASETRPGRRGEEGGARPVGSWPSDAPAARHYLREGR